MSELTHFNEQGRAKMVDVTDKAVTHRTAVAAGEIHMAPETLQKIKDGTMKKGDVLAVAQVAGIQAAKHNWELIPMCHPLPLTGIDITFALSDEPCHGGDPGRRHLHRRHRRGDGGPDRRVRGGSDHLRHVQGCPEGHAHRKHPPAGQVRRQERRLQDKGVSRLATVVSVNISEKKGTSKHPVPEIQLKLRHGIVGDAHAGDWHRQISLLAEESVDTMRAACPIPLDAGVFAENINTRGIDLKHLPVGTHLRIGETEVEVTQIGKECHSDCAIKKAVGKCVMPTEGIFAVVIKEGTVRAGDAIEILEAEK